MFCMRTTLSIDDDVLSAARSLAKERGTSVGRMVSELARRGLRPDPKIRYRNNFPVFEVREDSAPLTSDMVRAALDEDIR